MLKEILKCYLIKINAKIIFEKSKIILVKIVFN